MKKSDAKLYARLVCILVIGVLVSYASACLAAEAKPAEPGKVGTTLENLMASFNGESNAHARYLAFAKKADEEGYGPVASLFRAAAAAEEVHFKAQAKVIKKLGGEPKADIKTPEVKTTKENLEAAVKGESYERDKMYPEFLAVAEKEKVEAAAELFSETKAVEAAHAKLYEEALGNLDGWKGAKKDFFVCPVCGNTVITLSFKKCPICGTSKSKFAKVN